MTEPERRRPSAGLILLRVLATLLVLVFGLGTAVLALYYYAYSTLDGTAPSETIALVLELLVIAALSVLLLIQAWRPRRPRS